MTHQLVTYLHVSYQLVTLSPAARAQAARLGVSEIGIRRARARSVSEHDRPMYLVVDGELEDGRHVRMSCLHSLPSHVVSIDLPA